MWTFGKMPFDCTEIGYKRRPERISSSIRQNDIKDGKNFVYLTDWGSQASKWA
jgi:hypothetical protein